MPDIQPDFSAPGASGIVQIASWALGLGTLIAFIAFVFLAVTLAFKGFGNQGMQQFASGAILWAFIGTAALGSLSGLFALVVGFDLGLG